MLLLATRVGDWTDATTLRQSAFAPNWTSRSASWVAVRSDSKKPPFGRLFAPAENVKDQNVLLIERTTVSPLTTLLVVLFGAVSNTR